MKITRVYARDFLSYQELDLSLADRGLCLVEGENQDTGGSNGSGKSSIFEAVVWCLFGKTTKGVGADEIIRHDAMGEQVKGETYVCVEILDEGVTYEVYRHRKHRKNGNKCILFVNGRDKTSSTDTATQKLINQILRLDYKSFISSVMYPQKAENFVELTDSERKDIFSKLIGTERFSEALARVKAKKKELEARSNEKILKQSSIIGAMDTCLSQITATEKNIADYDRQRVSQIQEKEEQMNTLQSTFVEMVDPAWQERIDVLEESTKNGIKPYQARLAELHKTNTDLLSRRSTVQQRVHYIDSLPDDFPDADKQKPEKSSEELQRDSAQWQQAKVRAEVELGQVEADLKRIKFEVASQGDYTHCETCGQELSEEARIKIFGNLGTQLDHLQDRQELLTRQIGEFDQKARELQAAYEQASRYHSYLATLQTKAERPNVMTELLQIDREIEALGKEKTEIEELCNRVIEEFQEKEALQKRITETLQKQEEHRNRLSTLSREIERIRDAENPYKVVLEDLKQKGQQLDKDYTEITEHIGQDQAMLVRYGFWVDGFGKSGVESLLFDHAIPALNEKANAYLSELTGGQAFIWFDTQKTLASGATKEAFACQVSFAGAGQNYRQVSGGEAQRVNLATTLALGDLCAERSNAPVSLRLLDEPFESLDGVGAEQVVKLLYNTIVPIAGTVLVMTHDENLKSLVPNRIKVTKNRGISTLT